MAVHVVQEIRAEHVGQGGHQNPAPLPPESSEEPPDPQARPKKHGAQPEALDHPVGESHDLAAQEERADRPQVADVLMGDRS